MSYEVFLLFYVMLRRTTHAHTIGADKSKNVYACMDVCIYTDVYT